MSNDPNRQYHPPQWNGQSGGYPPPPQSQYPVSKLVLFEAHSPRPELVGVLQPCHLTLDEHLLP